MEAIPADLRGEHRDEVLDWCALKLRGDGFDERSGARWTAFVEVGGQILGDQLKAFVQHIHATDCTPPIGDRCNPLSLFFFPLALIMAYVVRDRRVAVAYKH